MIDQTLLRIASEMLSVIFYLGGIAAFCCGQNDLAYFALLLAIYANIDANKEPSK